MGSSYFPWRKVIVIVSFITVFVSFSIRSGFGILLPEIVSELGLTNTQGGYLGSAYFIAYMVFAPLLGIFSDKIGGRIVITVSCAVMATGTLLMGSVTSFTTAFLSHFIVGIGAAACWAPVSILLQKWFNRMQRGLALGILTTGAYSATAIVGLVLPLLLLGWGWRFSWYLLGIVAFVLVPINGILLRNGSRNIYTRDQNGISSRNISTAYVGYGKILKAKKFWLLGISYLAMAFSTNIVYVFLVTYAFEELKMVYSLASLLVSVQALGGIIGALVLSTLSNRIGRKKSLIISNLTLAFVLLALPIVGSNLLLLTLVLITFGVFTGGMWPIYASCAAEYFPQSVAGTVMGFWTTLYGIGSMISPPTAGYLTDHFGSFLFSFTMSSMISVVAALLIVKVKDSDSPCKVDA